MVLSDCQFREQCEYSCVHLFGDVVSTPDGTCFGVGLLCRALALLVFIVGSRASCAVSHLEYT